jgi:hypothetical protein
MRSKRRFRVSIAATRDDMFFPRGRFLSRRGTER